MKRTMVALSLMMAAASVFAGGSEAYLGVHIQSLSEHDTAALGYEGKGVLIQSVMDDSAAAKAGLKEQDIIVDINGGEVTTANELIKSLKVFEPGDEVSLQILRDGEPRNIVVALGERPHAIYNPRKWVFMIDENSAWLGIEMHKLTPQLAKFFGVETGVLVESVLENSPAEAAGLQAGDILRNWEGTLLEDTQDLYKSLAEAAEGDQVNLMVLRKGKEMTLAVTLGARKDAPESNRPQILEFTGKDFGDAFKFNYDFKPGNLLFEGKTDEAMKAVRQELDELRKELDQLKGERR